MSRFGTVKSRSFVMIVVKCIFKYILKLANNLGTVNNVKMVDEERSTHLNIDAIWRLGLITPIIGL